MEQKRDERNGQGGSKSGGKRRRRRRGGGNPPQGASSPQGRPAGHGNGNRPQQASGAPHHRSSKGGKAEREHRANGSREVLDPRFARRDRTDKAEPDFTHVPKRYNVLFYDTLAAAKADLERIAKEAEAVDQLNVVIRADANMDDPELLAIGKVKVFAGTAWALIHDRRKEEGWYDAPR